MFAKIGLALLAALLLVPTSASAVSGIVNNRGAEADVGSTDASCGGDVDVAGWEPETGAFTAVQYGTGSFPSTADSAAINGGANFFAGGCAASSSGTQTFDFSGAAAQIDTGNLSSSLSAYLGGSDTQDDNARVVVTFRNALGGAIGTQQIGPVLAADRGGQTGLVLRHSQTTLPIGTRAVELVLSMERVSGASNDGYADNINYNNVTVTGTVPTEGPPGHANCSDGVDNDSDGLIDAADPDCSATEGPPGSPSCSDSLDNDLDGKVDAADASCQSVSGGLAGKKCFGKPATLSGGGTVIGTPGDDVIVTGSGVDNVEGRGGNDAICTLDGNDTIRGGAGNDTIFPGRGDDDVDGQGGNDDVFGAAGDDTIKGGDGVDVVRGQDGNDSVSGGDGDGDKAIGGDGSDVLAGNAGANDTCAGDYDGSAAPSGTDTLAADSGCEVITEVP